VSTITKDVGDSNIPERLCCSATRARRVAAASERRLNADNRNAQLSEVDANPEDVASAYNYGITETALVVMAVFVLLLLLRVAG
jgi:hypothetical protein